MKRGIEVKVIGVSGNDMLREGMDGVVREGTGGGRVLLGVRERWLGEGDTGGGREMLRGFGWQVWKEALTGR